MSSIGSINYDGYPSSIYPSLSSSSNSNGNANVNAWAPSIGFNRDLSGYEYNDAIARLQELC